MGGCPFCAPRAELVVFDEPLVRGLWDGFPVASGHALVVVRRHVGRWAELTGDERGAITDGVERLRIAIEAQHPADGFTIGLNDGAAAGQTIPHLHVHLIPRRRGDVDDPRGGVRWVIPAKARYW